MDSSQPKIVIHFLMKLFLCIGQMKSAASQRSMSQQHRVFVYGTLKRGFANHYLLEELIASYDADFLGEYVTELDLPLVCGPYGIPFLLNLPSADAGGHKIRGELYQVSSKGLERLDWLEGISLGHYERLPIRISPINEADGSRGGDVVVAEAEAYYGHRSFAEALWRRNGRVGCRLYTESQGKDYVKKEYRPKDRSFLDEIQLFCSESDGAV